MCGDNVKDWSLWLPLAEWWYNTTFHSATGTTPYEVVYNQPPPLHLPYMTGESTNVTVDRNLQKRETMIANLKHHLARAQCRIKNQSDKHRSDRIFQIGDWVWLKLQPYRQTTLSQRANQKLSQRYFGPFQVEAMVGKVAYKLRLPADAKIHNVFHVSLLKAFHGVPPLFASVPDWMQVPETSSLHPEAILQMQVCKVNNAVQIQYLVQWKGKPTHEATWVIAESFVQQFPDFPLQDALTGLQS